MKKAALIFCIFLFSLAACKHINSDIGTIQSSSLEAPPEKIVLLSFLCRHEETIMKLAYYDSQSKSLAAQFFFMNVMAKECVKFEEPVKFVIDEVLTEYTDYEDEDIVVLKVKNQAVTGYVLVIKNKLIQGMI
tara:strand:+ start:1002 stop:1400 length:399 start_codon:yes stop_codon:yes gene_type:complete